MSRSERLLNLLQAFRHHRRPVSGQDLADEIGVSIRTLYRDIASLRAQGAAIEGEPGIGYVMKPGFMLPPMMFNSEELDALVLGMRWARDRGDAALSRGALSALSKISAVLPPDRRRELQESPLLVGARVTKPADSIDSEIVRAAIRDEVKLEIDYEDAEGVVTERTVWPFALVYFDLSRIAMCWCELRSDFRNFRLDRMRNANLLVTRYPKRRYVLLKEWRQTHHVPNKSLLPEADSKLD